MVYCSKCGAELREDSVFCYKCGANVKPTATVEGKTGFEVLTQDKTAQDHWLRRVLAFVVDALIVYVAVTVLVLVAVLPSFVAGGGFPGWWGVWFGGLIPLIILAYFVLAEWLYGRTIGKQVMGFKVVRRDGQRMDIWTSFVRNISKIFFLLLILDAAAGLAMRGEMSQKFSDRYIGTSVETTNKLRIIT